MANVRTCLEEVMKLEGITGAVLVDLKSGKMLGIAGDTPNLDIEAAANADLVKAKFKVLSSLDSKETVEDIVITLGQRYQLLRCLGGAQGLMLYLNMHRQLANLANVRLKLSQLEAELVI
jgi:hypothetical protein